jgi:hypothetical protein
MTKKNHFYKLATISFSLFLLSSSFSPSVSAFQSKNYTDCVRKATHDTKIQKQAIGSVRNAGIKTKSLIHEYCARKHAESVYKKTWMK